MGRQFFFATGVSNVDSDAAAYLSAAGVTDTYGAYNTFYTGLKSNNIYTKIQGMWFLMNGTLASCKLNGVNPVDSDAAFRLVATGSPTFGGTGCAFNGTSQFLNTKYTPSTNCASASSMSMGFYSQTNNSTGRDMGARSASNAVCYIDIALSSTFEVQCNGGGGGYVIGTNTDGRGFYQASRTVVGTMNGSKNSTTYSSAVSSDTRPSREIYIGAFNSDLGVTYGTKTCSFAYIGSGLTTSEMVTMYNLIQAFMTSYGINQ